MWGSSSELCMQPGTRHLRGRQSSRKTWKELGFDECAVTNGVFTHSQRDLRTVDHVKDLLVSRELHDLPMVPKYAT